MDGPFGWTREGEVEAAASEGAASASAAIMASTTSGPVTRNLALGEPGRIANENRHPGPPDLDESGSAAGDVPVVGGHYGYLTPGTSRWIDFFDQLTSGITQR